MRKLLVIASALVTVSCASQPDYRSIVADPATAASVDLERYSGLWYEIARYPNRFEAGCAGVTASYSLRDDGRVRVVNTCRQGGTDGPSSEAEGIARVVENSGNAQLEVKFAPAWVPFAWGDYWILHLEPDYSAALVGDPEGTYLWILARQSELEPDTLRRIRSRAEELGYQADRLVMTEHD